MHKTDQMVEQIISVFAAHVMSDRKAASFRLSLMKLVEVARAEDQMPLRVQIEALNAITKAKQTKHGC